MRFVCIDTETTGLNPENDSKLIEVSAVEIIDDKIKTKDIFQYFLNPDVYIPPYITKINGITNSLLRTYGEESFFVMTEFKQFIGDSILVFQNAGFDLKFLNYELRKLKLKIIKNKYVDTMEMSRHIFKNERYHNLDAICSRFNILIENRHRAFGDALATAQAFIKMNKIKPFTFFLKDKVY